MSVLPGLMMCLLLFQGQQDVLVLKDGRIIGTYGGYEILGDEVHFTDGKDQRLILPLKKLDLEATRSRNQPKPLKESPQEVIPPAPLQAKREYTVAPTKPKKQESAAPASLKLVHLNEAVDRAQAFLKAGHEHEQANTRYWIWTLMFFLGLTGLFSFGVAVYALALAFRESPFIGLGLTISMLVPIALLLFGKFINHHPLLDLPSVLLFPLLLTWFICVDSYGNRLKMLCLFYSPVVVLSIWTILVLALVPVLPAF